MSGVRGKDTLLFSFQREEKEATGTNREFKDSGQGVIMGESQGQIMKSPVLLW